MQNNSILAKVDWLTFLLYLALVTAGFFNIYSAGFETEGTAYLDFSRSHGRQLMWIGISLLVGFVILLLDVRLITRLSFVLYGLIVLLLVYTIFLGDTVSGSKSWLILGPIRVQPSEFAKLATVLALSRLLSRYELDITEWRSFLLACAVLLLPSALVLLQNDTGTALVFFALFLVLYREGMHHMLLILPFLVGIFFVGVLLAGKIPMLAGLAVLLGFGVFLFRKRKTALKLVGFSGVVLAASIFAVDFAFHELLQPHQQARIEVLLGKEQDLRGAGYNVHQSLIAIGSGGLDGKGFLEGTQTKFNFVPEQNTDFIFCTVGEEHGFYGSMGLLALYIALLARLIVRADAQRFRFTRVFGYGLASMLLLHIAVNISMTLGLFPVIGIPLPFVSYGGSSLLSFSLLIFVFLKLDASLDHDYIRL
jgi:rod shape determining protein RodA